MLSLRLVDPRFYHLDTALCVLDADTAAYYPAAFDDAGEAALAGHFAELIEAKDEDAEALGLNAISDGRHVVLPEQATGLASQLSAAGLRAGRPVDLSEFLKAGGGPKCCTLELRSGKRRPASQVRRTWLDRRHPRRSSCAPRPQRTARTTTTRCRS